METANTIATNMSMPDNGPKIWDTEDASIPGLTSRQSSVVLRTTSQMVWLFVMATPFFSRKVCSSFCLEMNWLAAKCAEPSSRWPFAFLYWFLPVWDLFYKVKVEDNGTRVLRPLCLLFFVIWSIVALVVVMIPADTFATPLVSSNFSKMSSWLLELPLYANIGWSATIMRLGEIKKAMNLHIRS